MMYYRCKCGSREAWTSMGVYQCEKCKKCGSNLAMGPNSHREPEPHVFDAVEQVQTDEGPKPLSRCRYCYRTKAEIEKRGD